MSEIIVKNLSKVLNEKQTKALIGLMKDGRLTDSKLKDILELKSVSAAAHYRKKLEREGIIKGYTAVVDWEALGYNTKFVILVEGKNKKAFHEIARDHVLSTGEYLKAVGDILITPTLFGNVVLEDVVTSVGDVGIIVGIAPSEDAAKSYCDLYLKERYPTAKMKLFLIRDVTIKDFFIQKDFIKAYMKMINISKRDLKRLKEFSNTFPWEKLMG